MYLKNYLRLVLLSYFLVLLVPKVSHAQVQNDTTKIIATINKMFEGMRLGNEELFLSAFDTSAVLMSIGNSLGRTVVHSDDYRSFAKAVGTPHPQVWDERISNPVIHISGELATVWTEYNFYLGDKLNHCGTDSFQLVRRDDGWKILVIVDTRKKTGCEE